MNRIIFSILSVLFLTTGLQAAPANAPVGSELFASGDGTAGSPYVIENADQWMNMVQMINLGAGYAKMHYKIAKDINFKKKKVSPIRYFKGTVDGGNHTLSNAKIGDGTTSHQAFFFLLGGTVKNLKFDSITVTGGQASGAASSAAVITAGNSSVAFTLDNCHVSNSTVISGPHDGDRGGQYAAGLVARCNNAEAVIRNCTVSNTAITAVNANAGAFVGFCGNGVIENAKSIGNKITVGRNFAGGVFGCFVAGVAENIESSKNVVTAYRCAGGVAGEMKDGTLINIVSSDNICTVTTMSAGGVVGNCTSDNGRIVNVLCKANTMKSLTHNNTLYLGGVIGGNGTPLATLLANCLVLSGTTEYVHNESPEAPYVACVGIFAGYRTLTWDNCIYNQDCRTGFDPEFTKRAEANGVKKDWTYRYGVGVKKVLVAKASDAGTDRLGTLCTALTQDKLSDGTCLNLLNGWVENNKGTYSPLVSWTADENGYPVIKF